MRPLNNGDACCLSGATTPQSAEHYGIGGMPCESMASDTEKTTWWPKLNRTQPTQCASHGELFAMIWLLLGTLCPWTPEVKEHASIATC